jgi:transmembrane sensor
VELKFNSIEEVIANEFFLAWYFKKDELKAKEWEHWLLDHPEYASLIQESILWLKEHYIIEKELDTQKVEEAYLKLDKALDAAPVVVMRPKRRNWWVPAAAAILVFAIAGFIYWGSKPMKTTMDSQYGKISQYSLPDGSEVTLNANSEITINKEWKQGTDREVWLKGEAFFKVQKTPAKNRFIVHANTMDIIVTGTQFNVVSREDESNVLLTEGSVTIITSDGKEIHMKPGDFVVINHNEPAKQVADQDRVLAWKQSRLDFENTPMNEVARIITRHYGVKVTLSDKTIADKPVTGVMPNDNLDVLIQALEATGEFKITKTNNEIIVSAP